MATKMFKRTENGVTQWMSIREGLKEINHAMMEGKSEVREMFAGSRGARITYKDGRRVMFMKLDAPVETPAPQQTEPPADERPDAWSVASHKMLLHRFTQADKDGRALCNKSYRPWRYGNGYSFAAKAEYQAREHAHLYTFCPRCESKG